MAEKQSWQNQNMKKSGAVTGPSSMNPKIASCSFHSSSAKVASPNFKKFADGGMVEDEAADKATGMAASANDDVGFFKRLTMGNIDQEGSEAYNQLGAGRAKADASSSARENARMKQMDSDKAESAAAPAKQTDMPDTEFGDLEGAMKRVADAQEATTMAAKEPVRAASAKSKPAAKAKALSTADTSLSQRLGKQYLDIESAAVNAAKMPDASAESKTRVRTLADKARMAYEDAADSERTGRSVVLKR
ncbi:MAG: hypothetical protein HQ446_06280 [Polaromonas sp.]|nr:hypothetical protein [Polaromonas sp.]